MKIYKITSVEGLWTYLGGCVMTMYVFFVILLFWAGCVCTSLETTVGWQNVLLHLGSGIMAVLMIYFIKIVIEMKQKITIYFKPKRKKK